MLSYEKAALQLPQATPSKGFLSSLSLASKQEERKAPLRGSHSPSYTVGNHFSCALLFRLQTPDTGILPFFGVCLAQAVDKGSQNNAAQEKPTHGQTNSCSALFSNSTERQNPDNVHLLIFRPYFPMQGILNIFLWFSLSITVSMDGHS